MDEFRAFFPPIPRLSLFMNNCVWVIRSWCVVLGCAQEWRCSCALALFLEERPQSLSHTPFHGILLPPTSLTKSRSFVYHTHTPPLFCSSPPIGCAPSFTFALFLCSPLPSGPRASSAEPLCRLVPPSLYAHHVQDYGETSGRSWCYRTLLLRQDYSYPLPAWCSGTYEDPVLVWSRGPEEPQSSSSLA